MELDAFLRDQKLGITDWDLLLFGDGSGQTWKDAGGFCCFLVDGRQHVRTHILGGRNRTTVNRMELSAYTEALSLHFHEMLEGKMPEQPYRVWVFTDSEYTAKTGRGEYKRRANADLWAVLDWYEERGYKVRWRWVPRNSTPLHEKADELAGKARIAVSELVLPDESLYELLPAGSIPQPDTPVSLTYCPQCSTPMLPTEDVCPACGKKISSDAV